MLACFFPPDPVLSYKAKSVIAFSFFFILFLLQTVYRYAVTYCAFRQIAQHLHFKSLILHILESPVDFGREFGTIRISHAYRPAR